jgi:hypothetical protein
MRTSDADPKIIAKLANIIAARCNEDPDFIAFDLANDGYGEDEIELAFRKAIDEDDTGLIEAALRRATNDS